MTGEWGQRSQGTAGEGWGSMPSAGNVQRGKDSMFGHYLGGKWLSHSHVTCNFSMPFQQIKIPHP